MGHLQPPRNRNPRVLIFDPTSVVIFILLVYPSLEVSVAHGYFCHALNCFFLFDTPQNVLLRSSYGASGSTAAA